MTASEAWSNFYDFGDILSFCLRDLDEMDAVYAQEAFEDGFNGIKEDYYKNEYMRIIIKIEVIPDEYKSGYKFINISKNL